MKCLIIQPRNKDIMEKLPYPYIINTETGEVLHQEIHKENPKRFIGFTLTGEYEIKIDLPSASILSDKFLSTIRGEIYNPVFADKNNCFYTAIFPNGYTLSIKEE